MNPTEYLDQLDQARAKATPGPWAQNDADPAYVIGQVSDDGEEYLDVADAGARCSPGRPGWEEAEADAALIVAAVNALPKLTAAIRAALDRDDKLNHDADARGHGDVAWGIRYATAEIREAITTALGGAE